MSVCDFCSAPDPARSFPARDGLTAGRMRPDGEIEMVESRGAWLACAECARLIDRDDREGLYRRACEWLLGTHSMLGSEAASSRVLIGHMQDRFFELRVPAVGLEEQS